MLVLNESLKLIRGIKYYDAEDYTLFCLPRSRIQPYIILSKYISVKELLHVASTISIPHLDKMRKILMALIKDICSRDLTILYGQDKLFEQIYRYFHDYKAIEELAQESEKQLPVITHNTNANAKGKTKANANAKAKVKIDKPLSR
jgi:hypothetical protein